MGETPEGGEPEDVDVLLRYDANDGTGIGIT